jgi:hypothetical protein
MLELETVSAPGAYDLREDSYHADPCPEPSLSGSLIKVLERTHSDTFDLGTAFHTLVLGMGKQLVPLDFKDWRTDAAKTARQEYRDQGLIPLLKPQFEKAQAMAAAVSYQIQFWEELQLAMAAGIPERTYIWQEETPFGPIWCRCLVDWTAQHGNLHPDWKTTEQGAGPEEWGAKTCWNLDAHIQAAWNARALRKAGVAHAELFFAVAETQFPHVLACMKPESVAIAMAERDIERAIVTWAWCLKNNKWPGYRNQMAWISPPPWKEKGFLEREERNELDRETTIQRLEQAADARANLQLPEPVEGDAFGLPPIEEGPAK